MKYRAQHPQNPCRLPDAEQSPAKLWELLRRNERFQRTVARLRAIDQRVRAAQAERTRLDDLLRAEQDKGSNDQVRLNTLEGARDHAAATRVAAWARSSFLLRALARHNSFASVALQWLVPEPLFSIQRWEFPKGFSGPGPVSLELVSMGEGATPDPKDRNHWRWFRSHGDFNADSRANLAGRLNRRGPELHWCTSSVPHLADRVNPIAEWRDYFAKHQFTLDTHWRDAPLGFRRTLLFLWRQLDSRATNPITDNRSDAPVEHEVTFFRDFSLNKMFLETANRGHRNVDNLAHALRFAELADHYRVFAFPQSIRTRMEARRMAKWLVEELVQLPDGTRLPAREKVILGTPLEWDMLLAYEDRRRQGDEHAAALRYTFDTLYLHQPEARRHADKPAERTLDAALQHLVAKSFLSTGESTRWHSWQDDFAHIHSPFAGTGLIQRIFPRLASVLPPTPAPAAP